MIGEFGASSGLTGSLQADKHDHIALSLLELVGWVLAIKHCGQLLYHRLLNELPNVETVPLAGADVKRDLGLDRGLQPLDVLDVHVGREKSRSDFCQYFLD
jgi:hypothetical protein